VAAALFIDPVSRHFERDGLFDVDDPRLNRDNAVVPYAYLREWFTQRGVRVHTADRLIRNEVRERVNVYVSMGITRNYRVLARQPDVTLSAYFALECPIVEPRPYRDLPVMARYFRRIFSYSDTESLKPFTGSPIHVHRFWIPQALDGIREDIWRRQDRGFLTIINRNKLPALYTQELYTERLRAVEFFSRTNGIDLYGVGWDGPPFQMGTTWMPAPARRAKRALIRWWHRYRPDPLLEAARRAYRGPLDSKLETLGRYRFAICFENMVLSGWITEKIFDCFFAGTIPIYLGAPDVEEYIPAESFIDMRRFAGYEELAEHLKSLSARQVASYRECARAFVESPQFHRFTKEAFTALFARLLSEDTGLVLNGEV
jgi:hypothetical protein